MLEAKARTLGAEHPSTLATKHGLALVCSARGRHEEAERLCREVLEATARTLGEEHPGTLITKNNLERLLEEHGSELGDS